MTPKVIRDRPISLAEWEPPCKNCGRFGTIPGQLISDNFNNTFCSADCGWSHLLRPHEQQRVLYEKARAAAATAAIEIAAAPRPRRPAPRRPSRSSRQPVPPHQQSSQSRQTRTSDSSRLPTPVQDVPVKVSARRPPKSPTQGGRGKHAKGSHGDTVERATRSCIYSGNAMFDYCIATGGLADL